MPNRVAVFIDGMNMRSFLRELEWEEFVDVHRLAQLLAGGHKLVSCDYCIGEPNEKHLGTDRCKLEKDYYAKVHRPPFVEVHYGYMAQRPSMARSTWGDVRIRRWVEKQVDVLIACLMIYKATRGAFDTAILVSADADLIPAVEIVQESGKQVLPVVFPKPQSGVGWSSWPVSHGLLGTCNRPIINANKRAFRKLP